MVTTTRKLDPYSEGVDKDGTPLLSHSYTILQTVETEENRLIQIRDGWDAFVWDGEWDNESETWDTDKDAKKKCKPAKEDDGTFWVSAKEFYQNFDGVIVTMVAPWLETRVKGKFIKVTAADDTKKESVISKFFYEIDVPNDTRAIIGIHQEDEKVFGVSDRRPNVDMGWALLWNEGGELTLMEQADYSTARENAREVDLEAGSYILVPMTSGALVQHPKGIKSSPVEYVSTKLPGLGRVPHPYWKSSLQSVFKKTDLGLKRALDKQDLNLLGQVMDIELLKNLEDSDFNTAKGKLSYFACNERGLTEYGFVELMTDPEEVKEGELKGGMKALGYDEELFSNKSRAYVFSIHSEKKVKVKMGDTLKSTFATTAAALFNDAHLKEKGTGGGIGDSLIKRENYTLFMNYHPDSNGTTVNVINKSDTALEVSAKLTSKKFYSCPTKGKATVKVPPKSFLPLLDAIPYGKDPVPLAEDDFEVEAEATELSEPGSDEEDDE